MTSRSLVVVADDFGLTERTSRAIVECFEDGVVTATSILANAPAFTSSVPMLLDTPGLEVGLHGALVGEDPPICEAQQIPTLVDRRGRLARSWRGLLPRLATGRVDPADVGRELTAQMARVREAGVQVTHLNLHQHLQLWPSLQPTVTRLCTSEGITYVRTPRSARRGAKGAALGKLADRLHRTLRAADIATNDGFAGLDEAGSWDDDELERAIVATPGEVVELNVHPGADHDDQRARYRWGYAWGRERAALLRPALHDSLARAGFELTGPSRIRPPGTGRG